MLKRIKILNQDTNQVLVMSENSNQNWASQNGYSNDLHDVDIAYDGKYYLKGFAPQKPEPTYIEKRISEYPEITEQLDMMYHDFENWKKVISDIKAKYPKQ